MALRPIPAEMESDGLERLRARTYPRPSPMESGCAFGGETSVRVYVCEKCTLRQGSWMIGIDRSGIQNDERSGRHLRRCFKSIREDAISDKAERQTPATLYVAGVTGVKVDEVQTPGAVGIDSRKS